MNRADGVPRNQGYYLGTWEECEAVAGHELDGLPYMLSHVDRPGDARFGGYCAHCGEWVGTGWVWLPSVLDRERFFQLELDRVLSTARAA